jgi:hypothetical protein
VPGLGADSAQQIIAEVGPTAATFPSEKQPGNSETSATGSNYPILNTLIQHRRSDSQPCWYFVAKNASCKGLAPSLADAYQLQSPGFLGNVGRNTLRGPHTNVFDFALMRDFPIHESIGLQFRWEVFNLTNTVQFGQPATTSAAARLAK